MAGTAKVLGREEGLFPGTVTKQQTWFSLSLFITILNLPNVSQK